MERCISKGISNVDRGAALYELCEYVVAAGFAAIWTAVWPSWFLASRLR